MTDNEIVSVFPEVSDDEVSGSLRRLTETIARTGVEPSAGLLGGEFGYGCDYENDVFVMWPFWWGDCDCGRDEAEYAFEEMNPHLDTCYQIELKRRTGAGDNWIGDECRKLAAEWGLPEVGCAVHCTCGAHERWTAWAESHPHAPRCSEGRPNFEHKPSGSVVRWYKYIGRSMEIDIRGEWTQILGDCLASLPAPEDT